MWLKGTDKKTKPNKKFEAMRKKLLTTQAKQGKRKTVR
jgi:hypothetical protein